MPEATILKRLSRDPARHRTFPLASAGTLPALLAMLALTMVNIVVGQVGFLHWNLVNGILFAVLWVLAREWWPWVFTAAIAARIVTGVVVGTRMHFEGGFLTYWNDATLFVLGNLLEPFLIVSGIALLRHWRSAPDVIGGLHDMGRLHLAVLVSAFFLTMKDLAYVLHEGVISDLRHSLILNTVKLGGPEDALLLSTFGVKNFLGHFVAIMLVAPLLAWSCVPGYRSGSAGILREAGSVLLPLMVGFVWLAVQWPASQLTELLRLLLMGAVVIFALRHGWRGAALLVAVASIAIGLEDHLGTGSHSPVWLQMFIAITGATGLLLGTTVDGLRQQGRTLLETNRKTEAMASELHAAAVRNLQVEEKERRRLAAELHDEFGQNLTALQTHLRLAMHDASATTTSLDTLTELTCVMRHNIGGILERLQPAALEQLGLYGAIDRGSIRHLVEDAGLRFEIELQGDARLLGLLDDSTRIAAYRLAQEAITNVVRHARAAHCSVRLRINRRSSYLWLFLDVRDDGIGRADSLRPGNGLRGMHARVLALGGRLHLSDFMPGLRLHALLRQQDLQ